MKTIDLEQLYQFLHSHPNPTLETDLLREFFPKTSFNLGDLDFFKAHFSLHHHLYRLKDKLAQQGEENLHIQLSSVYIIPLPKPGKCKHFNNETIEYCSQPCGTENFCSVHNTATALPQMDGLKNYYLDLNNYSGMDHDSWTRMNKTMDFTINNSDEIEKSLKVLGLSLPLTKERLKRRFRYLSKEHHPDKEGDSKQFQRISEAYEILENWIFQDSI